jgi:uncharacterized hydrophobic protein (TIGR00271 family)
VLAHLRLTVPASLTDDVVRALGNPDWVTNLVVQRGVCLRPEGDLVECDLAREVIGPIIDDLTDLGVAEAGGIVVTAPVATPFAAVDRLEKAAPGDPDDVVIWRAVRERAKAMSRPTLTYHLLLVFATMLAAIAVIEDSPILVVGAMVVGPEFASVGAVCVGLVFRDAPLVWRSLRLMVFGLGFAVAVVTVIAVAGRILAVYVVSDVTRPRPLTGFIWHPDVWSVLVALIAGMVGVLALATEKTATMVGVFISVTTVPAAGNLALGLATLQRHEVVGSAEQLAVNLTGMVVAGTAFLLLQRATWPFLTRHTERLFGVSEPGASVAHPAGGSSSG